MIKKYKIREIAMILGKEGTEKAGLPLGKKMVLKADDAPNEEPRTTVWLDHPECEGAVVGGYISGYLDKPKGNPIPDRPGSFYVNRTLYATEKNPNGTEAVPGVMETEFTSLVAWAKTQGYTQVTVPPTGPTTAGSSDDIKPEDIPF